MSMTLYYCLNTETTIRHIVDGLLRDNKEFSKKAVYIGFDMRITTDAKNYDQRSVAMGVHLLYFQGRMLMAVNDKFLFPNFDASYEWVHVSDHDSCWADSTMHDIGSIVRDVMTHKNESKYTKRYGDDNLTYNESDYNINLSVGRVSIINRKYLKKVVFEKEGTKRPLIRKVMRIRS